MHVRMESGAGSRGSADHQHAEPAASAVSRVRELAARLVKEDAPSVLDITAGAIPSMPDSIGSSRMVGLGTDESALSANLTLTEHHVQDITTDSKLPFNDHEFDVVIGVFPVDHLTRPADLFWEASRVLKPGGLFLAVYSQALIPPRFSNTWKQAGDDERLLALLEAFVKSDRFESPRVFVAKDTSHPDGAHESEPLYAVYADARGGNGATRHVARSQLAQHAAGQQEIDERKRWMRHTLECPYCGEALEKWMVPDTPFNEWPNEYFYVCFNDDCPYFVRGWDLVGGLGNVGSYRLIYDPEKDVCHAAPVIGSSAVPRG